MDRFRKTLSLRKKKSPTQEDDPNVKPISWQEDERKVRDGCCSFQVKYLGHIEVFDSRGMQVCEEAIKALRRPKKKAVRAILYVSGDTIRVSDEISKGLIVDQTIEKVSFCSPDRNHKKGFAYICRDGTTRRWMCHAFLAVKESGERLSHAVGCAFAICLEKKQKRENEVNSTYNATESKPVSKTSSFRQTSLSERLIDPQSAIIADPPPAVPPHPPAINSNTPATTSVNNVGYSDSVTSTGGLNSTSSPSHSIGSGSQVAASAVPRPHASASFFSDRQTSLRMFPKLQESSPFKRELSLRLAELPSNSAFNNFSGDDFDSLTKATSQLKQQIDGGTAKTSNGSTLTSTTAPGTTNTVKSLCASETSGSDSPSHFYSHSRYHSTDESVVKQILPHHNQLSIQHQQQQMSSSLILPSEPSTNRDDSLPSNNPFLMTGIINYGISSGFNSQERLPTSKQESSIGDGTSFSNFESGISNSITNAPQTTIQSSTTNNTIETAAFQNMKLFDTELQLQQHDDNNNFTKINQNQHTSPHHQFNGAAVAGNRSDSFSNTPFYSIKASTGDNNDVWGSPFTSPRPQSNQDSASLSSTNPWNQSSPSHSNTIIDNNRSTTSNLPINTNKYSSPTKYSTLAGKPNQFFDNTGSVSSNTSSTIDPFDVSWIGGSSGHNTAYSPNMNNLSIQPSHQPISPLVSNSTSAAPTSSATTINTNPFVTT